MNWLATGALLSAAGVAFGAFGAHGLRARVSPEALKNWDSATFYLFSCAFGLLLLGVLERLRAEAPRTGVALGAGTALLSGALLFSGSLYAWVLGAPRAVVFVTPLGGVCMIVGWLLFAWHVR